VVWKAVLYCTAPAAVVVCRIVRVRVIMEVTVSGAACDGQVVCWEMYCVVGTKVVKVDALRWRVVVSVIVTWLGALWA
jgi:hypothetical protein